MRRSNAPTLQDVAQQAGVTAMMASVVLNGARSSTRVSAASRARILEAATRLGYRRNAAALGLARRKMDTLGVVAVVDGGDINLYFHEVLNGILEAAAENRQNTTLFSIKDWKEEEGRILDWCDGRIDGMILVGPLLSETFAQRFPSHTPFVTIHGNIPLPYTCNMDIDNEAAAYRMTRYLIACGHRNIVHVSGGGFSGAPARRQGFRRALEEACIPWDPSRVLPGKGNAESGRAAITELLRRQPVEPLPDAIFCANDASALGCMEMLAQHGLRVPEDISIAGFDDTLIARMTHPALTTVRQPLRQLGRRSVERLLELQNAPATTEEKTHASCSAAVESASQVPAELFAVELVIRETVAVPREKSVVLADLSHRESHARTEERLNQPTS